MERCEAGPPRSHATCPADAPGPWAAALAGQWREAAAAWGALGERYEQAVEQALSVDDRARAAGLAMLSDLGATATLTRVRSGQSPPT